MSYLNDATNQSHPSTMLDQFNTKEDVLKLGVVARELEEVSRSKLFFLDIFLTAILDSQA
jgi:hypothetical protein